MPNLVVSSSSESHGCCGSCSGSSMEDDAKKRTVNHDYHDHAEESPTILDVKKMKQQEEDIKKRRGPRGGVAQPFPEKLHLMLSTLDRDDIVTWQPHGRCFVVHNAKAFVDQVMPKYFRQTKLTSFQRQLNLYGFCRLTGGRDRGGYYHELFLRNRPFLCKRMMRTRIKGTGIKAASSPQTEPDFYQMPPVEDLPKSSDSADDSCKRSRKESVPTRVTPPPALVTPIHKPIENPPDIPMEIVLDMALDAEVPQPDSLIDFEGQHFHYLDPSTFTGNISTLRYCTRVEWTADDFPMSDVIVS